MLSRVVMCSQETVAVIYIVPYSEKEESEGMF